MTKREAKAWALSCLAAETEHHIANGSEWLENGNEGPFSEKDRARVVVAVGEIAYELRRRAETLSTPPRVLRQRRLAELVRKYR